MNLLIRYFPLNKLNKNVIFTQYVVNANENIERFAYCSILYEDFSDEILL